MERPPHLQRLSCGSSQMGFQYPSMTWPELFRQRLSKTMTITEDADNIIRLPKIGNGGCDTLSTNCSAFCRSGCGR